MFLHITYKAKIKNLYDERKSEMKKTFKILGRIILGLIALLMAFVLFTIFFHKIKTKKEISDLKGRGYYNPVSVGDYSLNVSSFGKNNGNHTVVGLAVRRRRLRCSTISLYLLIELDMELVRILIKK